MLRSMTGFGKAEMTKGEITASVEIKSLNGKQLDINLRIPAMLKPYEFDIRNQLQQSLIRGSLDVLINVRQNGSSRPVVINTDLAKKYYESISSLAKELHLPEDDVLGALLKLPEVVAPSSEEISNEEWLFVKEILRQSMEDLDKHRLDEGAVLEKDLLLRIQHIENLQEEIKMEDPLRMEKIRQRLGSSLEEWIGKENIDKNRLEQELVFYIEKLDISEEQVRLQNHCRYFKEVLKEKEQALGKKLNFILQEVGREINTTGAKANDAIIQKCVVRMKDELEKAKEQIMNVL
ncbi:MAG: YicC family protein [Chitinophagaceae bacterium]|nr:MAG: YicC family protein [Chitinophagaceae bacterium]